MLTKPVRPTVLVAGVVTSTSPRRKYDNDAARYTDEVVGYEAVIATDSGGQVGVRFDVEQPAPPVLSHVGILVAIGESREYGAVFYYERQVTHDDLDKINSALPVPAKA